MSQLSRLFILIAVLFASPAIALPKFGVMGGIGSATSTYAGQEPSGGTFSIRGDTGAATFGSVTATGGASVGSISASGAGSFGSLATSGAATVGGNLTVNGGQSIVQSGAAGSSRFSYSKTGTLARWGYGATGDAEAGSNAGSNFAVYRFDDTGAYLSAPLSISRATGTVTIPSLTVAGGPIAAGCANILAYGGDKTGANDNSAAFSAAVGASANWQVCVYLPAGIYKFTSTPTVTLASAFDRASVTIKGDGAEATQIVMAPGVSGPTINITAAQQSFHVRDLAVLASATETGNVAGIALNSPLFGPSSQNDITNVTVRGADGYNKAYRFTYAVKDNGVSNVNFVGDILTGSSAGAAYVPTSITSYGIYLAGTSTTTPVQFNIIGCQLNYWAYAVGYGSYAQGLSIGQSNFVGNAISIYLPDGNVGNDELAITGSQFNDGSYNIYVGGQLDGVGISGSMFYVYGNPTPGGNVGSNIYLKQAGQYAISANGFIGLVPPGGSAPNGIVVGNWLLDSGVITGNQFKSFATAVILQSASQHANVQSNGYSSNGANVLNSGTNNTVGGGSQ